MPAYRVMSYDAVCETHGNHTLESKLAAEDSEEALERTADFMARRNGCKITDFGCYVATPIMPAKTGRKDD